MLCPCDACMTICTHGHNKQLHCLATFDLQLKCQRKRRTCIESPGARAVEECAHFVWVLVEQGVAAETIWAVQMLGHLQRRQCVYRETHSCSNVHAACTTVTPWQCHSEHQGTRTTVSMHAMRTCRSCK